MRNCYALARLGHNVLPYDYLTPHFRAFELGAERAPTSVLPNLKRTADYLEVIRAELATPLVVNHGSVINRGWRSPTSNIQVGGSATSSHLVGLAADFNAQGMSSWKAYNRLKAAKKSGRLPAFDQIIYYPFGHLHLGLGPQLRNEFRIRIRENVYALDITPPEGSTTTPNVVVLAALAFVALVVTFAIMA